MARGVDDVASLARAAAHLAALRAQALRMRRCTHPESVDKFIVVHLAVTINVGCCDQRIHLGLLETTELHEHGAQLFGRDRP